MIFSNSFHYGILCFISQLSKKEFLIVILNALAGGALLFYTFQFMKSSEKKE